MSLDCHSERMLQASPTICHGLQSHIMQKYSSSSHSADLLVSVAVRYLVWTVIVNVRRERKAAYRQIKGNCEWQEFRWQLFSYVTFSLGLDTLLDYMSFEGCVWWCCSLRVNRNGAEQINVLQMWHLTHLRLDVLLIKYPQFPDVLNTLNVQLYNIFLLMFWHCKLCSWAPECRNCRQIV